MPRRTRCSAAVLIGGLLTITAATGPAGAGAAAPDAIRTGGPSSPADAKLALVGSGTARAGQAFRVSDAAGRIVLRGRLAAATGHAAPWRRAAIADLSAVRRPGRYRVRTGRLTSGVWTVRTHASGEGVATILRFFDTNRDGAEPSAAHAPSHLHDRAAIVTGGPHDGAPVDVSGGWMDAGDMLKFTHTTAYAAAMLQYAARLDGPDAAALRAAADTGVRWLVKAHPSAGLFIAQVGDARDHDLGFRDPAADDASTAPGIGTRLAFAGIGGDLGGKAALALALAAERAPAGPARRALLQQAREWYAAGAAAGGTMKTRGPQSGDFYLGDTAEDALAAGAAALYRLTGEPVYLDDALRDLAAITPDGRLSWNAVAGLAAADLCGQLGAPAVADAGARETACAALGAQGAAAVAQARTGVFGTPGAFGWGQAGENGGAGALAALAGRAGRTPAGLTVGATARDWLLGRNPWGASFVTGYGPQAPRHVHHWGPAAGAGQPVGAVVGGPAPRTDILEQHVGTPVTSPFDTPEATYEDRAADYVTSEPALDYAAGAVLLLAAVDPAPAG